MLNGIVAFAKLLGHIGLDSCVHDTLMFSKTVGINDDGSTLMSIYAPNLLAMA